MAEDTTGDGTAPVDLVETSSHVISWAKRCADRAERFRSEDRHILADAQMERCVEHLKLALAVYPGNLSARFFLVGTFMSLGQLANAKDHAIQTICELCEDNNAKMQDPVLYLAIAHISSRLGQDEDATAFLQRATDEFPQHPQPCAELARVLASAGRHHIGEKMARLALDRNSCPDCPCGAHLTQHVHIATVRTLGECLLAEQGLKYIGESEAEAKLLEIEQRHSATDAAAVREYLFDLRMRARLAGEEEANGAVRYGRLDNLQSISLDGSSPSQVSCVKHAAVWAKANKFSGSLMLKEEGLGTHYLAVDIAVRLDASFLSAELGPISIDDKINITSMKYNSNEGIEWGKVASPEGWIPMCNLRTGFRWTRSHSSSPSGACTVKAAARSKDFGPPDQPGLQEEDSLRTAAMEDLERLFSGLVPSTYRGPDVDGKGNASNQDAARRQRCAACCTTVCYACRKTCCD